MQDELSHEVKNSLSVYILAQVLLSEKPEFYYEKFFDFLYIFCISNGTYQNAGQKLISTGPATGSSLRMHGNSKQSYR